MKYTLAVAALIATAAAADEKAKDKEAKCTITKFELFKDKDCTKAEEKAAVDTAKGTFKEGCVDLSAGGKTSSVKSSCDAKAFTTQKYKTADCKGEAEGKASTIEWGKCTE